MSKRFPSAIFLPQGFDIDLLNSFHTLACQFHLA